MKYVRPFSLDSWRSGPCPQWLLGPEEGAGLTIRLHRGGVQPGQAQASSNERFVLVLAGQPLLQQAGQEQSVAVGDLAFIPAGAAARVLGTEADAWAEIDATLGDEARAAAQGDAAARVIQVDPSRFEGGGFAYQSMIERKQGAQTMRINVLQVQPGSGSPDFHIHEFAQIYLIQEGAMTLDVGKQRLVARKDSLVVLPAGVVHRNFNASAGIERHISLLVPEPREGQIFDYAITIHDREAELMQQLPSDASRPA